MDLEASYFTQFSTGNSSIPLYKDKKVFDAVHFSSASIDTKTYLASYLM
jgi:hypothetical protein